MSSESDAPRLACMEVWGGNQAVDTTLGTVGLDARVLSCPYGDSDHGGDVYSISSCSSGRITRLLLADVTGHGDLVAGIATGLRRLLHRYINTINSAELMQSISEDFRRNHRPGLFATAILATYFEPTRKLTLLNGGHPAPLFYRAVEKRWRLLDLHVSSDERVRADETAGGAVRDEKPVDRPKRPSNLPLGLFATSDYDRLEIELDPDDMVLFYTDALIEAENREGEQLGLDGLKRLVERIEPERGLVDELTRAVAAWRGAAQAGDDLTLMLIRANRQKTRWQDDLAAPLRYLRHRWQNRNRRGGGNGPSNQSDDWGIVREHLAS